MDFGQTFETGLEYDAFLEQYGSPQERSQWATVRDNIVLSPAQRELLASFVREMKVLVLAGTWCGDCVAQCPIFDRFVEANAKIRVRYFDRDDNPELGDTISTCGAHRVPSVLFLSEDNHVCGRYGDRTLAKYRSMAASSIGYPVADTGSPLPEQVTQQWLDEFERIQLMLRLSGRLRKLHWD